ncbi:raftlin-like isoform X2 [Hypomesus transpacificus]|uniref:raftlin-like isoform X2 n=1 Tax=Hypomesus transpacificus TaxID=137520 RepID=UPI001F07FAF8|nr:raftlin-like isoform X2 [Hypomesus transpacificus]
MGCGLRKLKPSEENSPGKIYSTLKRPQVETKVGVAYTYRFLDFLIGKDDGTSTLRLVSVRELPSQLQDLYQQGFVLAAVHPFIHPCGPDTTSTQHQLYRAVLSRLNEGDKSQSIPAASYRLQLEHCLPGDQVPTPELIQGYVKKQIQDAADQGITFVGFIQEPRGAPATKIHLEPETPSLSLHSSPSSMLGSLSSGSPLTPRNHGEQSSPDQENMEAPDSPCEVQGESLPGTPGKSGLTGVDVNHDGGSSQAVSPSSDEQSQEEIEEDTLTHNNNKTNTTGPKEKPSLYTKRNGMELLALFNHPAVRESQLKYYTVKVPLRVQLRGEGVKGVEANWLDHMTQHFNNGASLVDGYFHLGNDNDLLPKSVESVFIFQEATEGESNTTTTYDAIVVEQWTVIDGLQVKTDYVPLLQSLAMYGWRLTCVLPTPIIKTNSDGSLSTKQIVFLQRPVLPRRSRESKKLMFKNRSKSNKNSVKDVPKTKKKKNKPSEGEKELEDPKILEDGEKFVEEESQSLDEKEDVEERVKKAEVETEWKETVAPEEMKTDNGTKSGLETGEELDGDVGTEVRVGKDKRAEEQAKGMANTDQKQEGQMETVTPVENGGVEDTTEMVIVTEGVEETKDEMFKTGEIEIEEVKENGIETEKEKDGDGESTKSKNVAMQQNTPKQEEPLVQEEVQEEMFVDGHVTVTNQSPEKTLGTAE